MECDGFRVERLVLCHYRWHGVFPVPPYVLYSFLGELKRQGARNGLIAAMLFNRNVKIHFIPAINYYFGMPYAIVLSVYILLFSLVNGKILEMCVGKEAGSYQIVTVSMSKSSLLDMRTSIAREKGRCGAL